jgi:lysophospholipase L1-like esterase
LIDDAVVIGILGNGRLGPQYRPAGGAARYNVRLTMRGRIPLLLACLAVFAALPGCGGNPNQPRPPVEYPAPAITCPAPITIAGVTGGAQNVPFQVPGATGGAPPLTVTCSPASGASFPVGDTQVTCTAVDAQVRQASCSFTVKLTALQLTATKFLAFGDSMTTGENGRPLSLEPFRPFIDEANAYPRLLLEMLRNAFPGQEIAMANAGIGGRRVTDPGEEQRLTEAVLAHRPSAVLLLQGINDVNGGVEPETVVAGLKDHIRTIRDRDVPFVFVSTLLPGKPGRRQPPAAAVIATNALIRPMVPAAGAHLVDPYDAFAANVNDYIDEDGLHLTPAGNRALAEAFFERIKAVMATTPGVLWSPER